MALSFMLFKEFTSEALDETLWISAIKTVIRITCMLNHPVLKKRNPIDSRASSRESLSIYIT